MSNLAFNSISDALIMDGHGVFVWVVFFNFSCSDISVF